MSAETLQAFADAWNRHDTDAIMSFMSDDCVFEASAGPDITGTRYAGREALRAGYDDVFAIRVTINHSCGVISRSIN